ncbi:coenzyme Q biosynthesis protein Coq4 [Colletotrichum godetiae]|uniref:4-hydroxy-3-methoxy-5-polyprenylbenzoate decarboxylase n=1 Tax=Colletotrichum godetiae TaxID=1209918 RepID=A0AAJ0AEY3_9PEZI|nr:coenzyme Q biosynthesis protein Coq4 [Colletotrichum godetiae]KAK1672634.1 coenzyme Q biosynthesis protein Coq4 [Colletotrichum godetiae]
MKVLTSLPAAQTRRALPAICAACTSTIPSSSSSSSSSSRRPFSVLNRPPPNYPGHIPLTKIERAALGLGAGIWSLLSPYRGDLIAAVGETTATPYFIYRLRDAMLADPTGRRILRDRPRITSTSLNLSRLRAMPDNSVGRAYVAWLDAEGVSPDTRPVVRYIDDPECAYVMQRYRECHDFFHALTGLPIVREGEVALKAFEFANTLIPMTGFAVLSYATMKAGERKRFREIYGPWAVKNGMKSKEVINVYWEEQLERDVDELRADLGIERPPNMREIRKREREERRRAQEALKGV